MVRRQEAMQGGAQKDFKGKGYVIFLIELSNGYICIHDTYHFASTFCSITEILKIKVNSISKYIVSH